MFSYYSIWIRNYSKLVQPLLNCQLFPLNSDAVKYFQSLKRHFWGLSGSFGWNPVASDRDWRILYIHSSYSFPARPTCSFLFQNTWPDLKNFNPLSREKLLSILKQYVSGGFIIGRKFTIITDQQAVPFMFNPCHSSEIRNDIEVVPWTFWTSV